MEKKIIWYKEPVIYGCGDGPLMMDFQISVAMVLSLEYIRSLRFSKTRKQFLRALVERLSVSEVLVSDSDSVRFRFRKQVVQFRL
ncbi:hypothetical protein Tco_0527462 [Tanacetum coccineum]